MPSGIGNPFYIPQIKMTGLQMPKGQSDSLAMLIKTQEALAKQRLMEARIAAMQARAVGGSGEPKVGRYTNVIELPTADGGKEKVAVEGPSQKERDAKAAQMLAKRRKQILDNDPEMQKLRTGFEQKSLPAQKEALEKMRQTAIPRLSKVLDMPGEELTKSIVQPLQSQYEARDKSVNSSDFLGTLGKLGKVAYNSVSNAIASFTDDASEMVKRGSAMDEQRRADNPYLDEARRLEAEGRSTFDLRVRNPFKATAEFTEPIVTSTAGALAGGLVGTALGGPGGGLLGAMVGGGLLGGLQGRGEAIERVATSDMSEEQKLATIADAANLGTAVSTATGAIPMGPAQLGRMGLRSLAINRGTQAALAEGTPAILARAQAINQVNNAAAKQSLRAVVSKEMATNAVDAGVLNAGEVLGQNWAYNMATGQNVPLSDNVTDALFAGGGLGALLGLPGTRGIWRRRNQYGGQAFQTRQDQQALQAADDYIKGGVDNATLQQGSFTPNTNNVLYTADGRPLPMPAAPTDIVALRDKIKNAKSKTQLEKILQDHYNSNGSRDEVLQVFNDLGISNDLNKKGEPKAWKRKVEENVNRARTSDSSGNKQPANMDQSGPAGKGRANNQDSLTDSASPRNPEATPEPAPNANLEQPVASDTNAQERRTTGTEPLNSRKTATDEAIADKQGLTGEERTNGKSSDSPAAETSAAADTGERSGQSKTGTSKSSAGDAATAGSFEPVKAVREVLTKTKKHKDFDEQINNLLSSGKVTPDDVMSAVLSKMIERDRYAPDPTAIFAKDVFLHKYKYVKTYGSKLDQRAMERAKEFREKQLNTEQQNGLQEKGEKAREVKNIPTRAEMDEADKASSISQLFEAAGVDPETIKQAKKKSRAKKSHAQKENAARIQAVQTSLTNMGGRIDRAIAEGGVIGKDKLFSPTVTPEEARQQLSSLLVRKALEQYGPEYTKPLTAKENALVTKSMEDLAIGPPLIPKLTAEAYLVEAAQRDYKGSIADLITADTVGSARTIKNDKPIC